MKILGVSFDYHDAAAALLVDGTLVAAVQEERFSRRKNDARLPKTAIAFCLNQAGLRASDLDAIVHYEQPILKFDRILWSSQQTSNGSTWFQHALKTWLYAGKFDVRRRLAEVTGLSEDRIYFVGHHDSHLAAAYYGSSFQDACIITLDGVGEYDTMAIGHGCGDRITPLARVPFPHSIGLFYSAMTAFLGFEVNDGEYKVMGMAAYGRPRLAAAMRALFDIQGDGTFRLDQTHFNFLTPQETVLTRSLTDWLGPPRQPNSLFRIGDGADDVNDGGAATSAHYADIAASVQRCTEDVILSIVRRALAHTGPRPVCLAGGVALNGLANGRIRRELDVPLYVHPAAGDAGGAFGAAAWYHHQVAGRARMTPPATAYSGPAYDDAAMLRALESYSGAVRVTPCESNLDAANIAASLLADGEVIGWFQGRTEWGPRALGNRSILASPLRADMKAVVNERIKFREPFRPFAPAVTADAAAQYFELPKTVQPDDPECFMLAVHRVRPEMASVIPATTHVDGTARIQVVFPDANPPFYRLLCAFAARTGVPVLLNTSFNLRGEPIVNSPSDALRTFFNTAIDVMILGRFVVRKEVWL